MSFELATAESEYAKDPNINRDHIQSLMQWVKEHPRLPDVTEFMLIQCYQVTDYDYEQCKKLVEIYYGFKNKIPELFTGRDFDPLKYNICYYDVHGTFIIPKITCRGYRMIYYRLKNNDTKNFDITVTLTWWIKIMFLSVLEEGSCPGYMVIADTSNYKFSHVRKLNLTLLRKMIQFLCEGIPCKVKEIHFIHANKITNYMLEIFKPFCSKEIRDMFYCHTDMNKFYQAVPKECVPKDLGGNLPLTQDEYVEIARKKMTHFSKNVDAELQKASRA